MTLDEARTLESSAVALEAALGTFNTARTLFVAFNGSFNEVMDAYWQYVACKTDHNNTLADLGLTLEHA